MVPQEYTGYGHVNSKSAIDGSAEGGNDQIGIDFVGGMIHHTMGSDPMGRSQNLDKSLVEILVNGKTPFSLSPLQQQLAVPP